MIPDNVERAAYVADLAENQHPALKVYAALRHFQLTFVVCWANQPILAFIRSHEPSLWAHTNHILRYPDQHEIAESWRKGWLAKKVKHAVHIFASGVGRSYLG